MNSLKNQLQEAVYRNFKFIYCKIHS